MGRQGWAAVILMLLMASALFNFLLLAMVGLILYRVRRGPVERLGRTFLYSLFQVAFVAAVLAMTLTYGFGLIRFAAFAIFLHGPLLLAGLALVARRRRPRLAWTAAGGAVVILLVAVQAFLVEPHWLEVSRYSIDAPELEEPLRIVVLSDLQTDGLGDYEKRVVETALEQEPDLILMPGDYVQEADEERRRRLRQELAALFRQSSFGAPLGVVAVRGDVDGPGWQEAFAGTPVTVVTSTRTLDLGPVRVTALSAKDARRPDFAAPAVDAYSILLGHSPDFALGEVADADLLVAGHTHGGQVRLPLIGPLITFSQIPRAWAAGLTRLPSGPTLVVSRGIGMERGWAPRLRFLCRPQLVVLDLVPG